LNKRTKGIIYLLGLLVGLSLIQACAEAHPSYEVLSFNMTPTEIAAGDTATIEVQVRNNNSKTDIYNIPLMVDGVADSRESIILAPGQTGQLTFELTISHAGVFKVSVDDKESTLTVEKPPPPDFHLSNLEINPTEVNVGENVVIVAKLANVGGSPGSYTAELKLDGITNQTEKLVMSAGTDYMLVFKISPNSPGTHVVALGELAGKFLVIEPVQPIQLIDPATCPPSRQCGPGG
jgi:hypothetical protein